MAYTNNNGQARVGVRIVPLSVVIPTISALLDSYSGAAAAYSLRKLKSSYTGSAIRVRRSSDNTELNIGFDSDGNLDTYALSAFVGTGNGFVSIWYDQSGNGKNATQVTAAYQPIIVNSGVIHTLNNKPIIRNPDTRIVRCMNVPLSTLQSRPVSIIASGKIYQLPANGFGSVSFYLGGDVNVGGGSRYEFGVNPSSFFTNRRGNSASITVSNGANINSPFIQQGHFASGTITNRLNGVDVYNAVTDTDQFGITTNFVIIGANPNSTEFMSSIGMYEYIFYFTDKTSDRVGIESNINTYYSVYPNPTTVWNLLNAVYSADTIASSSLKTSLYAAYNGESNTNDSFGSNNGTAVGGLTYGTGKIGNAFQSNGTNSYISLPDNSLNLTGDFSISTWVYFTGLGTWQEVISNYFNTSMTQSGWDISVSPVGVLNFSTYRSNEIYQALPYNISSYLNQWVHLVVTRKPTVSNGHKIYINGTLVAQQTGMDPVYNSTQWCNINSLKYNGGVSYHLLSGSKIDALNVWQKELTQSEITELYNSGNGAQYIGDNFYKPTTNDALLVNNGTAQGGLTYGLGKVGTAFQFNGSNSLVSLPTNSMQFTGDFSFSLWVNLTSTTGVQCVFGNAGYASGQGDRGYMITFNSGKLGLYLYNGGNMGSCASTTTVSPNQWNHFVVIKEGQQMKIYCNGVLENTLAFTGSITYITPSTFPAIGVLYKHDGVSTSYYPLSNGSKIDAFNIWNKVLTQSEITELYNSGNGKQYPN